MGYYGTITESDYFPQKLEGMWFIRKEKQLEHEHPIWPTILRNIHFKRESPSNIKKMPIFPIHLLHFLQEYKHKRFVEVAL